VALFGFVWQRASTSSEIIATADIQTPYPVFDYQVGDRVCTSPESRDLLGCRRDNRSVSLIERVHIDFRKQCTNLKVVSKRIFPL
jgi:hypothetical protein